MEVIYWWPLYLFSLSLQLVLLSTLLSYLAVVGCLALRTFGCVYIYFTDLPPMNDRRRVYVTYFQES